MGLSDRCRRADCRIVVHCSNRQIAIGRWTVTVCSSFERLKFKISPMNQRRCNITSYDIWLPLALSDASLLQVMKSRGKPLTLLNRYLHLSPPSDIAMPFSTNVRDVQRTMFRMNQNVVSMTVPHRFV